MNENQMEDFAIMLTQVFAEYDKPASDFAVQAFWIALSRFDFDAVARAFNIHYSSPDNGKWPPKPGDIIRILEGGSGDRALLAWSKVDKAVRTVGPYESVVFDDPLIHSVIRDMGGWIKLGDCGERDFEFRGKEFCTRYRGYAENGKVDKFPAKLIGLAELSNSQTPGYDIDPPLLLGDSAKARLVLEQGGRNTGLKVTQAAPLDNLLEQLKQHKEPQT